MPKQILLIMICIVLLYGCGTTKIIDKNLLPYPADITLKINSDKAIFNFGMEANLSDGQKKFDFLNSITTVIIEVLDPDDSLFDKIEYKALDTKGTTDKEVQTSLSIFGSIDWNIPSKIKIKDYKFRFKVFSNNKYYSITKEFSDIYKENEEDKPAITMEPFVDKITGHSAVFGTVAKRIKLVDNEYLPTSETFIVEIINHNGNIVWSSSYGHNFLQVINPVLPKSKGETYKYTLEWNGNSSNQIPLIPGEYTIRMIIPAKPNNYTTSMNFKWKVKDDNK